MTWRERLSNLGEFAGQPQVLGWMLLLALLACAFLVIALVLQTARFNRAFGAKAAAGDTGKDARTMLGEGIEAAATAAVETLAVPPADRILPVGPKGFALLVAGAAAALWLVGMALAPGLPEFLSSPEWRFQPLYIAAHLVTLRLFVSTFTKNFRIGAAYLDVPADRATAGFRLILGPAGALSAALIAMPFCLLDYRYLFTDRYARLGAGGQIGSIDLMMWAIWSVEWFLNAFIWVVLVGFLVKNVRTIRAHPFRAPIETVLHEQHYRPFLQMSSQGAGILFLFSIVTALYIYFTGGELTDYMGLGITGTLLVIGFVIPWHLLRSKVRGAVRQQTSELGSRIALASTAKGMGLASPQHDLPAIAKRLDDAVALLRISHLQRQQLDLGWNEAKAVGIRLLAPAVTIAWHYGQSFALLMQKAQHGFQSLIGAMRPPL